MRFMFTLLFAAVNLALASQLKDEMYDDLVVYFQYASSSYSTTCAKPNGNILVSSISDDATDTQGFIARDDGRREIVVALRGSSSAEDFHTNAKFSLTPLVSLGINPPAGSTVHTGFLTAWNSVASSVIMTARTQLAEHPGYQLVSTGHSLGGALASLAAISLQQNLPGNIVRMYTYGQPRTFNPTAANWINEQFRSRAFRAVHTSDGVPTAIPQSAGYKHHGVEFWNFLDPSSARTTKACEASGEDPSCSDSVPSQGIDAAHNVYFNIAVQTTFCT
ncbi:alpha/beta-hydrolase [Mycena latifolia]|nr:alpha/beta-hydrolase [Mycena latifolia]